MTTPINQLTDGNEPDPSDLLAAERENNGTYSGIKLTAESLMKSHLAGKGVNLADYNFSYYRETRPTYPTQGSGVALSWDNSAATPASGWALKITGDSDNRLLGVVHAPTASPSYANCPIAVESGKQYLLSFYAKGDSSGCEFQCPISYRKSDETGTIIYYSVSDLTTEWARYSFLMTIPEGYDRMALRPRIIVREGDNEETIYVTGFMLEEYIGDGTNVIPSSYVPPVYIPE